MRLVYSATLIEIENPAGIWSKKYIAPQACDMGRLPDHLLKESRVVKGKSGDLTLRPT